MSEKIGQFELVTELAKSAFSTVYKATDTSTQQTVALKVVRLESVKDRPALLKAAFDEAERAKPLSSHNIAGLFGVGDENELLLASAEYVQGNSVATTLARHEGFSIWDLQDIARQVCQGLDHAHVHKVVHQSLEPAKIMVQWDGLVKVLGFGISGINATVSTSDKLPEVLHYASPEQLRGEPCDHRSAIFSLGAILYEMAAEQKAFPGESIEQVRTAILEGTPPLPHRVKPKVNPALSTIILKALAKSPDERYQSGQELVRDLEQCKSGTSVGAEAPKPTPPKPAAKPVAKASAAVASAGAATSAPSARPVVASAAPAAEEKPAFSVDPMMAENSGATASPIKSFSDVSELPPLREVRIAEPAPAAEEVEEPAPELPVATPAKAEPAKPRMQVRKAAQRAVREIRNTPPKLYLYAVSCAVFVIALYLAGMTFYNYFEDRDTNGRYSAVEPGPAPQPKVAPAQSANPAPAAQAQTSNPSESEAAEQPEGESSSSAARGRGRHKSKPTAPAVVSAQLTVNSMPAGADISFDGSVLCQSPCTLTGIAPGQHTISAAKAGYAAANRGVQLNSGGNESVLLQLNQLTAILSVSSTPAGAAIVIDGKDSGKLTPSQIILDKPGTHAITIRRYGYLDATSSVSIELGQTSSLNLQLTKLGSTDEIRGAGGKFKKVFGHGGDASGMGIVSVKTQPKGAQIMVNNRVLDKTAPYDFYLNPGTYVIDITMSGYRPLHRVVNIQEGEKLAIEESLVPE